MLEILQRVSGSSGTAVGQTRIHIDQVKGLGSFLEIEVVLKKGESDAEGAHTAEGLAKEFGIRESDLIHLAYVDLLRQRLVSTP